MSEPVIQLNKLTEKPTIIGRSKVFLDTMQKLFDYSQYRSIAILLYGESGVGKSFLARLCGSHNFVSVNCGSVTDSLSNSLFGGHTRGAFTDAKKTQSGFVASAEGGVLFLDEIGDLGLSAQPLLLTIIEEKEYIVVGENFTRKADVQFIAATNKDLNKMVSKGAFRGDLLERLTIKIYVPGLNERGKEDISLLCDYLFTKHENELNKECSSELKKKFLELALLHDWKNSNIRGLSNFIFQTVVEERIPENMKTSSSKNNHETAINIEELSKPRLITFEDLIDTYYNREKTMEQISNELEKDYLEAVGNLGPAKASEMLKISRSHFYKYKNAPTNNIKKKLDIVLNKNTSLRVIINQFQKRLYQKLKNDFPKLSQSDLADKMGESISSFHRRKNIDLNEDIYLGHTQCISEETNKSQENEYLPKVDSVTHETKTSQDLSACKLQAQINDFFEKLKAMEAELEILRAENKFFEEQYNGLKHLLIIK